ncbi:hypothetical protein VTJ04DRAFT_1996 [Mycothermus thermophilus]|uniref:uncharacterized protein n=1 Tax=Humicola insolens TaxID=85995 RepID=UPI0037448456
MPLRRIYPPPSVDGDDEDNAVIDIIAVHGLNPKNKKKEAHALDTWRAPPGKDGKLWLRDALPKKIKDARIFLYVYDSAVVYSKDQRTFVDKANGLLEDICAEREDREDRPLLLLGHSLGGLLIKQALINAHNNEEYASVKKAVKGLVFFGTPHSGYNDDKGLLVTVGQVAANTAQSLGFNKHGDKIVEVLERDSLFSDLMHEHWRHRLLEFPIVSFWGSQDTIVPKASATFGLPGKNEKIISLDADHSGVCKFGDTQTDQDNYKLVQRQIVELYKQAISRSCSINDNSKSTGLHHVHGMEPQVRQGYLLHHLPGVVSGQALMFAVQNPSAGPQVTFLPPSVVTLPARHNPLARDPAQSD